MDILTSSQDCCSLYGCLICWNKVQFCENKSYSQFQSSYKKLFSVFSKYMEWTIPSKNQFNFTNEFFPFCKSCLQLLVNMMELDDKVLSILQEINRFAAVARGKILISEETRKNTSDDIKGIKNSKYNGRKVRFCRDLTIKQFTPSVKLTSILENPTAAPTPRSRIDYSGTKSCTTKILEKENFPAENIGSRKIYVRVDQDQEAPVFFDEFDIQHEEIVDPGEITPNEIEDDYHEMKGEDAEDDFEDSTHAAFSNSDALTSDLNKNKKNTSIMNKNAHQQVKITVKIEANEVDDAVMDTGKVSDGDLGSDYKVEDDEEDEEDNYREEAKYSRRSRSKRSGATITRRKRRPSCPVVKLGDNKFEHRGFQFEQMENGKFNCCHCEYKHGPNQSAVTKHIREYHEETSDKRRPNRHPIVEVGKGQFRYRDFSFSIGDDSLLLCGQCPKQSPSRKCMIDHIRKHHAGVNPPKRKSSATVKHRPTNDDEKIKTYIPKAISSNENPKEYRYEKIEGGFKCEMCQHFTKTLRTMRCHIMVRHAQTEKTFTCQECGKGYNFKPYFKAHLRTHAKDREEICDYCGKSFKHIYDLRSHIARLHDDSRKKPFTCEFCGKDYWTQSTLLIHHENAHSIGTRRTFTCHICTKTLPLHSKTRHMRTHTGEFFKCPVCNKRYNSSHNFEEHLLTHNNGSNSNKRNKSKLQVKCQLCETTCANKVLYWKHMRSQHSVKRIRRKLTAGQRLTKENVEEASDSATGQLSDNASNSVADKLSVSDARTQSAVSTII